VTLRFRREETDHRAVRHFLRPYAPPTRCRIPRRAGDLKAGPRPSTERSQRRWERATLAPSIEPHSNHREIRHDNRFRTKFFNISC